MDEVFAKRLCELFEEHNKIEKEKLKVLKELNSNIKSIKEDVFSISTGDSPVHVITDGTVEVSKSN